MKIEILDKCPLCGSSLLWRILSCEKAQQVCSRAWNMDENGYVWPKKNACCFIGEPQDEVAVLLALAAAEQRAEVAGEALRMVSEMTECSTRCNGYRDELGCGLDCSDHVAGCYAIAEAELGEKGVEDGKDIST